MTGRETSLNHPRIVGKYPTVARARVYCLKKPGRNQSFLKCPAHDAETRERRPNRACRITNVADFPYHCRNIPYRKRIWNVRSRSHYFLDSATLTSFLEQLTALCTCPRKGAAGAWQTQSSLLHVGSCEFELELSWRLFGLSYVHKKREIHAFCLLSVTRTCPVCSRIFSIGRRRGPLVPGFGTKILRNDISGNMTNFKEGPVYRGM